MKKIISAVCAVALMASLAAPMQVAAATKDDIVNEMWAGFDVGDTHVNIPSKYVTLVVRYLAANNVTEKQMDKALAAARDIKAIWSASGIEYFRDLPQGTKVEFMGKAASLANELGATLTISGDTISIVDPNGKTYSVRAKHNLGTTFTSGGSTSGGSTGSNDPWNNGETSGETPDGGHWEVEGNTVTITDKDGNVSTIEINPIKQTGAGVDTSSAVAVAALLIAGLSATVIVARKNRLGEDCE